MTALALVSADWRHSAACREIDPDLFIGPDGEGDWARARREAKAKRVCAACPVSDACLDLATRTRSEGVWGGLNDDERRNLRRNRRTAPLEMAS